jgi:ribosomal protein S14
MKKLYFKELNLYLKNEILGLSFYLLIDTGFSKKVLKEKIITKDFKNLIINQNTCYLTGKRYSIFKSFRLSRISFRNRASLGLICGVRKSSW